mgnify:CR=1 FL=1
MKIETTILKNLLQNEDYARKVLPFLSDQYFTENSDKIVYNHINNFITKYNSLPDKEALDIELSDAKISEEDFRESLNLVNEISKDDQISSDLSWLLDSTEKFCQDKAIYNAVVESISILDNPQSKVDKGAIPDILSDALSVSFDPHVGHDYIDDSKSVLIYMGCGVHKIKKKAEQIACEEGIHKILG